ncbi:MAG: lipoate--protein ligase family protein [Candidatus Thorarchaeota archaeon]
MEEIRFIDLEVNPAAMNMAIDEAIMLAMRDGKAPPTLRIYRWQPSAVSIGVFQGMEEEVDVDFCREHGIDVVRRVTGGGAVYHDYDGEITYSIILPQGHRLVPSDIIESYEILCKGIVVALEQLGIDAQFHPINDIVTGGKKISGNAQTRRYGTVLQHGTTLMGLDVEKMFSILKVPKEKISDKMIKDVKQRVTSIRDMLGRDVEMRELRDALVEGFSTALGVKLVAGHLSETERQTAEELARTKYSSNDWNFSR